MPEVWITPQYVNEPKPGKKLGNIKTKELGYIWCQSEVLMNFQVNRRIFIEYTENGDFKNFKRFPNPEPHVAAPRVAAPAPRPQAPVNRPNAAAPQTFAAQVDTQALNIFVTGAVGRALGSGHFNAGDIDEIVREAKAAFMKHLSGVEPAPARKTSAPEPEFNDPLPDPESYGAVNSEDIPF